MHLFFINVADFDRDSDVEVDRNMDERDHLEGTGTCCACHYSLLHPEGPEEIKWELGFACFYTGKWEFGR